MNKEKKAALLKAYSNGHITLDELKREILRLNQSLKVITWEEIEPGIFKNDQGETYVITQPDPMILNVLIYHFNADGTRCPKPVSTEKDIDLES